jgi:hypothetical protein
MVLDYTIKTFEERVKVVNQIIEDNWEAINIYINDVFYINNKTSKLPFNYLLYQLTNYLLYCDKQPTYKEKTQQKFEKSTLPLDGDNENQIYELKKEVIITKGDIANIQEINEVQNFIKKLRHSNNPNLKGKRFKWMKDLKYNQIAIKESKLVLLGQYGRYPLPSFNEYYEINQSCYDFEISDINNPFNLDLFNRDSWKTVLKILPFKKQVSLNVDKLINIFNKCYHLCEFDTIQRKIIKLYQKEIKDLDFKVIKNKDIANKLHINQLDVAKYIRSICLKLCRTYDKLFTDFYYTYLVKGTYKTCNKCKQIKLIQSFKNNPDSPDGKHSVCKNCLDDMYKICSKCGQKLNKNEFSKHPETKDGLRNWCKRCRAEDQYLKRQK